MLGGMIMICAVQSGVRYLDSAQLQKMREILNAPGSNVDTRILAQAVLDLNDSVSGLLKAVELLTKKNKFHIGG
jgi:hypothetical protein